MSKDLIILGLCIILVGVLYPWLQKLNLGRLPGDIIIERAGFHFYFPITTGILVSIIISIFLKAVR